GGALAGRWPKRPLICWMQSAFLVLALLLAWLVLHGAVRPWQLLLVTVATGLVTAIDLPARLSFVMDMVGREDLTNAVALNSLLFNSARAFGSLMAGWLLLRLGAGECFLINAVSYLAVLLALAARVGDGVHGTAWLFSGVGVGALAAALTVATFGSPSRSWAFIAVGVVLVTTALLGLSLAGDILLAVCFSGLIGFGLILFLATSQSVFQLSSEEHNRGRIMAIWAMVLSAAVPLGNFLAGPAADEWGLSPVLAALGLACGLVPIGLLWMPR